jgi:succinate-semialdehyde dehydrogenase/glutarate-semialdehyde dehydrogenase
MVQKYTGVGILVAQARRGRIDVDRKGGRQVAEFPELGLFVHGEIIKAGKGGSVPLVNPADGVEIAALAQADETQLDEALASSRQGFEAWSRTSAYDRGRILRRGAQLIRDRSEALAVLMTTEQGKPLMESRIEWSMCADVLDWAAEEGRRVYGRVIPSRTIGVSQVVHKFPVGPVAAFAPWNFPAFSAVQKVAPALAAGCSIILKPATDTPASSVQLARLLHEAGLPDGALNVVHGQSSAVSRRLIESPVVRKVSLTGSVEVGRLIASQAGRNLKKCTMELGGHAPVIVLRDADVERIAPLAVAAKYRNAGQVCTSPTRFLIEEPVYERFVSAFLGHATGLRVGNGLSEQVQMGPLASARQVSTMERLVADALSRGADISLGGHRIESLGRGFFFEPTVIQNAPDDALVLNEEPFGPIAVMIRVKDVDEAIRRANALPFGLASYCFTHDSNLIDRVAREVEAGMLAFNQFQAGVIEAPFGGVKDSGFGAEGGTEGVDGYLVTKFVSHRAS